MVTYVDPPSGWRYGFPKAMPDDLPDSQTFRGWLVSEGYPKELIEEFGDNFHCSYWEEEKPNEK